MFGFSRTQTRKERLSTRRVQSQSHHHLLLVTKTTKVIDQKLLQVGCFRQLVAARISASIELRETEV
jgi:hypothetical protein